MTAPAELARQLFLASDDGPGPVAVHIVQRSRGTASTTMVEVLGRLPALRPAGVFFSQVEFIDPTDDGVFIDFADLGTLRETMRGEARQGAALCREKPAPQRIVMGVPVAPDQAHGDGSAPVEALERAARLLLWLVTMQQQRTLDSARALELVARRFTPGRAELVQAYLFGRLAHLPLPLRQRADIGTFFAHLDESIGEAMRNEVQRVQEPVRQAGARTREVEQRLAAVEEAMRAVEGGSHNPDYHYLANQRGALHVDLTRLRSEEQEVSRRVMNESGTSLGPRRRALYGAPLLDAPEPLDAA